jgi:hypothetical protein
MFGKVIAKHASNCHSAVVAVLGSLDKCAKRLLVSLFFCPRRTRTPGDGCSWNVIFDYFSKICRENASFFKIWQELRVLYVKTYVHIWYLAEFRLEWETFQTKVVEKIKTHNFFFFRKYCCLLYSVGRCYIAGEATDDNILGRRKDAICILDDYGKNTDTHS